MKTCLNFSAGQTSYGFANMAGNELCRARRAAGLPAVSISWGPIANVGVMAESDKVRHQQRSPLKAGVKVAGPAPHGYLWQLLVDRALHVGCRLFWQLLIPSVGLAEFWHAYVPADSATASGGGAVLPGRCAVRRPEQAACHYRLQPPAQPGRQSESPMCIPSFHAICTVQFKQAALRPALQMPAVARI